MGPLSYPKPFHLPFPESEMSKFREYHERRDWIFFLDFSQI